MVAEAVKVIVRCRPMNSREKDLKSKVRQHSIFIYLIMCVSCHNLNVLIGVEYQNCRLMLLSSAWMGQQIQSKLIYLSVTHGRASL